MDKRRLRVGRIGKQSREDTHQNTSGGKDHGESYSCNRKARKNSDFRRDCQAAPPFSSPTPQENQRNSPTRNKSAVLQFPGRRGAAPKFGLVLLHPGPGARPATMPLSGARVEVGETDTGPAHAPWTETGRARHRAVFGVEWGAFV